MWLAALNFILSFFGFVPKQDKAESLGRLEQQHADDAATRKLQEQQIHALETKKPLADSLRDGDF